MLPNGALMLTPSSARHGGACWRGSGWDKVGGRALCWSCQNPRARVFPYAMPSVREMQPNNRPSMQGFPATRRRPPPAARPPPPARPPPQPPRSCLMPFSGQLFDQWECRALQVEICRGRSPPPFPPAACGYGVGPSYPQPSCGIRPGTSRERREASICGEQRQMRQLQAGALPSAHRLDRRPPLFHHPLFAALVCRALGTMLASASARLRPVQVGLVGGGRAATGGALLLPHHAISRHAGHLAHHELGGQAW